MAVERTFELADFLPYLLSLAAENSGSEFQTGYKAKYGLLRTDWRVMFHLGLFGEMTARDICGRAKLHKTKVSRAVQRLAERRYLTRRTTPKDRRFEILALTVSGERVFEDLRQTAQHFDQRLAANFSGAETRILRKCLTVLAGP